MESSFSDQNKLEGLVSYRRCLERIRTAWPAFITRRAQRLEPHPLLGNAPEKITESILEDLFTVVLDWPLAGFNPQVDRADIVLSNLGIRRLIVEAKRPNSLATNRRAAEQALEQALGYAAGQSVRTVAISDGHMLFAADRADGGLRGRVCISLAGDEPPLDLWWLSVEGIYRLREPQVEFSVVAENIDSASAPENPITSEGALLHPKYRLPASCFAYVADHSKPRTWKLPYLSSDGHIDPKRLPKAIQCILTNYRGTRVSGIPEQAIPSVLSRLARAAARAGHMPPIAAHPAAAYLQLAEAIQQLGIVIEPE